MIRKLATLVAAGLFVAAPALADSPEPQYFAAIVLGTPATPGDNPASIWLDDAHGQASATAHAMQSCAAHHRAGCHVAASGANTCMAVAWTPRNPSSHWAWIDGDKQASITKAVTACREGAGVRECPYVWACSYGDPAKSSKPTNTD